MRLFFLLFMPLLFSGKMPPAPDAKSSCYEITEWELITEAGTKTKEDSIQLFLSVSSRSKYYNGYFKSIDKHDNEAVMRIHSVLKVDTLILTCFHAYREGRSIEYYLKDTECEGLIFSALNKDITVQRVGEGTFRCSYSYMENGTLCSAVFTMQTISCKRK